MKSSIFRYSFKVWLSSILLTMAFFLVLFFSRYPFRSEEVSFIKLALIPLPYAFFHSTICCFCIWGFLGRNQTATIMKGPGIKIVLSALVVILWLISLLTISRWYTMLTYFIINLTPPRLVKDFPQPYMIMDYGSFLWPAAMLICVWVFRVVRN